MLTTALIEEVARLIDQRKPAWVNCSICSVDNGYLRYCCPALLDYYRTSGNAGYRVSNGRCPPVCVCDIIIKERVKVGWSYPFGGKHTTYLFDYADPTFSLDKILTSFQGWLDLMQQQRTTKLLFLDIDGVLNDHRKLRNDYCTIDPDKVYLLDEIVRKTDCSIVLISAWRYLILNESMTLDGFRHLLATYGASRETLQALVYVLPHDVDVSDTHDRGKLVRHYLDTTFLAGTLAVVLDDGAFGYTENGLRHIQPIGTVGLTPELAQSTICLLDERNDSF